MSMLRFLLALVFAVGTAAPAAAQIGWDAPSFFSPRPGEDIGLYIVVPDGGDDVGVSAIWRQSGNLSLGVRGGIAGDQYSLGAEFYGPLDLLGPQSGLLMAWVLGVGATFNDVTVLRVPLGISAGIGLGAPGGVQLLPYVHPRVAFELAAYDVGDREETDTDFRFDVDLGADAVLGQSFVLRAGITFGRFTTFGAGVAYRIPRRVTVR
jgi:hypothetical protein